VRDALANSNRDSFNLISYAHCALGYCGTLPEFNALGLCSVSAAYLVESQLVYDGSGYVSQRGREAVFAFFECADDSEYDRMCGWTYHNGYPVPSVVIPTEMILGQIDEVLALEHA